MSAFEVFVIWVVGTALTAGWFMEREEPLLLSISSLWPVLPFYFLGRWLARRFK